MLRKRLLTAGIILLLVGIIGSVSWVMIGLPKLDQLDANLILPSTRIYDRHGRLLYELTPDNRPGRQRSLPIEEIPLHCRSAVIATEDAHFYEHGGIDWRGVARAAWSVVRYPDASVGGSTLTQQVARMVLLHPHQTAPRTLRRKLQEMVLAVQLEHRYSKADILALWLNQANFGNLAYGLEAASYAYFAKPASQLSLAECALLVGIPQAPAYYNPLLSPDTTRQRQAVVLGLMVEARDITAEQAHQAQQDTLQFASVPYPIHTPHAVLMVWDWLMRFYPDALYNDGLEVTTTLDLDWHNATQAIVQRQLERLNHPTDPYTIPAHATNSAVMVLDPNDGTVRVLLGSADYFEPSISGAINFATALRQPGSTLKPFTYALTFDPTSPPAWHPATVLMDVETAFVTQQQESYVPRNTDLQEHGAVSIRTALASSYNIPAVLALEQVGVPALQSLMAQLGVDSLQNIPNLDWSITLGGGAVRLLDLTAAYGALANRGQYHPPQLIERVVTIQGVTLYTRPNAEPRPVLDERIAFLITDILSDDRARTPGMGAHSILNIGRPSAAKTGTTTALRDNWVMGYTPDWVVGVWVGNADQSPMVNVTGLSGAAPIWHSVMRTLTENTPERSFAVPDGVVQHTVCIETGVLVQEGECSQTRREWFLVEEPPTVEYVAPIRFDTPYPFAIYERSRSLPIESQRVPFALHLPREAESVVYILNGEAYPAGNDHVLWWQLMTGEYSLSAQVTFADGEQVTVAPIRFRVVE